MKVELVSQSNMMRTQPMKKQMDVIVRYWSHSRKEIVVHFLSTSFSIMPKLLMLLVHYLIP
jgi:hypothetical protein